MGLISVDFFTLLMSIQNIFQVIKRVNVLGRKLQNTIAHLSKTVLNAVTRYWFRF